MAGTAEATAGAAAKRASWRCRPTAGSTQVTVCPVGVEHGEHIRAVGDAGLPADTGGQREPAASVQGSAATRSPAVAHRCYRADTR